MVNPTLICTFRYNLKNKTMKNLYILPTNKPSRLVKIYNDVNRETFTLKLDVEVNDSFKEYVNVYITSDEEITGFENDVWVYNNGRVWFWQNTMALRSNNKPKKIILTTDQDLIKDGVQAIDDEFLEWFVSKTNDSGKPIDIVEVNYGVLKPFQSKYKGYLIHFPGNEVLEEPKQETLEEAAFNYAKSLSKAIGDLENIVEMYKRYSFVEGAKWQAERMYSEEEVLSILKARENYLDNYPKNSLYISIKEFFEQFKKK